VQKTKHSLLFSLKYVLKEVRFFLIPYCIFLSFALVILAVFSKDEIHLAINRQYSPFWDAAMKTFTFLAEGYSIAVLVLVVVVINWRLGAFTGLAAFLASFITAMIKQHLFNNEPRPVYYFTELNQVPLRLVPGLENNLFDSFPSGHTTVAFAMYFCASFLVKKDWIKVLFFFLAATIGFSRIYLSQHFLADVCAGSLVGTLVSLLIIWPAYHRNWIRSELHLA
jgi:membrane-associated phospholipid phosphatase